MLSAIPPKSTGYKMLAGCSSANTSTIDYLARSRCSMKLHYINILLPPTMRLCFRIGLCVYVCAKYLRKLKTDFVEIFGGMGRGPKDQSSGVARGTWVHVPHVPRRSWKLAFVSGFWGLCPQTPTGALPLDPAGGLPSPRSPLLSPVANSWLRP